jgi:hypothetical protein
MSVTVLRLLFRVFAHMARNGYAERPQCFAARRARKQSPGGLVEEPLSDGEESGGAAQRLSRGDLCETAKNAPLRLSIVHFRCGLVQAVRAAATRLGAMGTGRIEPGMEGSTPVCRLSTRIAGAMQAVRAAAPRLDAMGREAESSRLRRGEPSFPRLSVVHCHHRLDVAVRGHGPEAALPSEEGKPRTYCSCPSGENT